MVNRAPSAALALALASGLFLTGCGENPILDSGGNPRVAAHSALSSGLQCSTPTAHSKHINIFACATCHPCGGFGFDPPFAFPGGTSTAGGTITPGDGTAPTTCSVACHFPNGGTATTVAWNAAAPLACTACHQIQTLPASHPPVSAGMTREECRRCHQFGGHMDGAVQLEGHVPGWSDRTSPTFHAATANLGLEDCRGCHGQNFEGTAAVPVACATCHNGTVASLWGTCTTCHGGLQNTSGAPPRLRWGSLDPVPVGAHTVHLAGSDIAPPFGCDVCHVTPPNALAAGHLGPPPAEVTFGGTALIRLNVPPIWDRASATCSNTYCHGELMRDGTNPDPVWTGGSAQAACGTCHGVPPARHPVREMNRCYPCHGETLYPDGTVIPPSLGGKHLDGILEAVGSHDEQWSDPLSSGFHAYGANGGLIGCTSCHGAALDGYAGGGIARACADCHDGLIAPAWPSCTMCHGGTNDASGAPPRSTWGNTAGQVAGAHDSHVRARHALSAPLGCEWCHQEPAQPLVQGHANGVTTVTGYTGPDTALQSVVTDPRYTRSGSTGSCATTYCHSQPGASLPQPQWTRLDGTNRRCTSCHALPPDDGPTDFRMAGGTKRAHYFHVFDMGKSCGTCHAGFSSATVNAAMHVNGRRDVARKGVVLTTGWGCGPCHALAAPPPPE